MNSKKNKRKIILFFIALTLGLTLVSAFYSNSLFHIMYAQKVWAHKTNNLESLEEIASKYSGIELDIVFHSDLNKFEVNHPPDPSLNIFLDQYLKKAIQNNADLKFWLDFKNLNIKNQKIALNHLIKLIIENGIEMTHVIVESRHAELLLPFKKAGVLTAYYLPQNLIDLDSLNRDLQFKRIEEKLKLNLTYMSTNYVDYPLILKQFPDSKKILWFTNYGAMSKIKARLQLYKIQNDKNVDVLLMPYD